MPLSPEARRALEALNRRPLKHEEEPPAAAEAPAATPPGTPASERPVRGRGASVSENPPTAALAVPLGAGRTAPPEGAAWLPQPGALPPSKGIRLPDLPVGETAVLERVVPGTVCACRGRSCFLHRRAVHTPSWRDVPISQMLLDAFARGCDEGNHPLSPLLGEDPEKLLLLDIESAGLSGGPLFMVGVLYLEGGALQVHQLFARDYTEEPGVLEHTRDLLAQRPMLVTFNGKSFDFPYIVNRCIYHRLPGPAAGHHVDLLHLARKRWRRRLPDCRLQTLERHLCRRHRVDDIPGELMARAYHDFVRTGDASEMRKVFHHNLMDLVTMAEVLCALAQ